MALCFSSATVCVKALPGTNLTTLSIAASDDFAYAVRSDGSVWAWGTNRVGELGVAPGTLSSINFPLRVAGITNAVMVAAGHYHGLALTANGQIFAWGTNNAGQLGNNSTTSSSTPVQVQNITNAIYIGAGRDHSVALLSDGTIRTWGDNTYGQLGDNSAEAFSKVPVSLTGTNAISIARISIGQRHNLALRQDGTLFSWGDNSLKQLGYSNSTISTSNVPAIVDTVTNVIDIAAGWYHSLVLKNDGTVLAWGINEDGEIGNGTQVSPVASPYTCSTLSNIVTIAAGPYQSGAIDTNGFFYRWGDEVFDYYTTPTWMDLAPRFVKIALGEEFGIGVTREQAVYAWGWNSEGELGEGTFNFNDYSPDADVRPRLVFGGIPVARSERFIRGVVPETDWTSFVLPLDQQQGVRLDPTGTDSYSFGAAKGWYTQIARSQKSHVRDVSSGGTVTRFTVENPIAAFGSDLGGSPLYLNQSYSFGAFAGVMDESATNSTNTIKISAYDRSGFSSGTTNIAATATWTINVPRRTVDTAAWGAFLTNYDALTVTSNGLTTRVEFGSDSVNQNWGIDWLLDSGGNPLVMSTVTLAGYKITHTASASATNYHFVVEVLGSVQTSSTAVTSFSKDGSGNWTTTPLYTLDFAARPALRSLFLDQPQFADTPLPPEYNGKSPEELLKLATVITNTIWVTNNSIYTNLDNSPELRQHPILDRFVTNMNNDPLRLASYVINEIDLVDPIGTSGTNVSQVSKVSTTGVNRSALGTFLEGQGSPIEQCALLVYFLRKAGYPAAYVWPTNDNVKVVDTRLSQMLGFKVRGITYAGTDLIKSTLVTVNYPWVVANIGTNSVQIFPWLKDVQMVEGLNLFDYMPTNYNQGYKWAKDYIMGNSTLLAVDPENNDPSHIFPKWLSQVLQTNAPGISIDDIGMRRIKRRIEHSRWQDLPLPSAFNFQDQVVVFENLSASQSFLTNIFNTLQVQVYKGSVGSGNLLIDSGALRVADLNARKFLLLTNSPTNLELWLAPYRPSATNTTAFTNDSALLNKEIISYGSPVSTNYIVRLTHLRHRAANALAIGFDNAFETLAVTNDRPYKLSDIAGLSISVGRVTRQMLQPHIDAFQQIETARLANSSYQPAVEDYKGTGAYLLGMSYLEQSSKWSDWIDDLTKIRELSFFAAALGKLSLTGTNVAGGVDMPVNNMVAIDNAGNRIDRDEPDRTLRTDNTWLQAVGGSALEHQIINWTFQEKNAISTVRLLQLAQARATNGNVGIIELSKANYLTEGASTHAGWGTATLQNQDTNLWANVVSDFTGPYGDFMRIFITPGNVTNETASFVGMGVLSVGIFGDFKALITGGTDGAIGELMAEWYDNNNTPSLRYDIEDEVDKNTDFSFEYNNPGSDYASGKTDITGKEVLDLTSSSDSNFTPGTSLDSAQSDQIHGTASGDGLENAADTGNLGGPDSESSDRARVADPVNIVTGEFYVNVADVKLPGPFPLLLKRNYLSQNLADNGFGHGWKMNLMPYLMMVTNSDGTILAAAAEMDGSVIYYRRQTNDVFLVDTRDNPTLNTQSSAGIGSIANLFLNRIDRTTNRARIFYTLKASDGAVRTFVERSDFPISGNGKTLGRVRPYLSTWADSRGNTLTFTFGTDSTADDYGLVNRIDSSNGSFLLLTYNADGRVVDAYTSDDRRVGYEYDRYGDLVTVIRPDESQIHYEYQHVPYSLTNGTTITTNIDSIHLITKEIRPDGRGLQNVYDSNRRVITQLATVGQDLQYYTNSTIAYTNNFDGTNTLYSTITGTTTVRDFFGNATTYSYAGSLITNIADPLGQTIQQMWYADNATSPGYHRSLWKIKDKRGLWTEFKYDSNGNLTNQVFTGDLTGNGNTSETATNLYTYNTNNLVLTVTDPVGITTATLYDSTFAYSPSQVVRYVGSTPIITNFITYGNFTNSVTNGGIVYISTAYGLPQQQIRAYGSPDAATNLLSYDGRGFLTQTIQMTGNSDPAITNTFFYSAHGEEVDKIDGAGRKLHTEFDTMGRVKAREVWEANATRPLSWDYTYFNDNGEVVWTDGPRYDPEDYVWQDYDGMGRLTTRIQWRSEARPDGTGVQSPSGDNLYAITYQFFDGFGNLAKTINPRGMITSNIWDSLGQLVQTTAYDTDGTTVLTKRGFSHEPGGNIHYETNALGAVSEALYTSVGKQRFFKSFAGVTNAHTFYLDGRPRRDIQNNGAFWETTYDDVNFRTIRTFFSTNGAALASLTNVVDRRGNVIRRTDAAGYTFTNVFDGLDRLKTSLGPVVAYTQPPNAPTISGAPATTQQAVTNYYDYAGIAFTNVNALGEKQITISDALGRTTYTETRNASDATVHAETVSYAANHHSKTVFEGNGQDSIPTVFFTDNRGNNVLTLAYPSYPSMTTVEYSWQQYDQSENLVAKQRYSVTGAEYTLWSTNSWSYDALNRVSSQVDKDGTTISFAYDLMGNLTNRATPIAIYRMLYNSAGQLTNEYEIGTRNTTRTNTYAYFQAGTLNAGLLQSRTDGRGVTTAYSYDDYYRTATAVDTGPLPEHYMTTALYYDVRNAITNITESFATNSTGASTAITRTYDPYHQLVSESVSIGGVTVENASLAFNSAGRRLQMGLNSFGYAYQWQADGRLTGTTGIVGTASYSYNTAGLLNTRVAGSLTETTSTRDGVGRPLSINTMLGGTNYMAETLTWTGDGQLATHTMARQDFTDARVYSYAPLTRRLSQEILGLNSTTMWTNSYTFDGGASAGSGMLTRAGQPESNGIAWQGARDAFSRIGTETNNVAHRFASGKVNGPATVTVQVDGLNMSAVEVGANAQEWTSEMELLPGTHGLTATAAHPSGRFSTSASVTFTNNAADQVSVTYSGEGQMSTRTWQTSGGTTLRTQTLSWDGKGRLLKVVDRDSSNNGRDWTAVYDGLNRRIQTIETEVTNNIAITGSPMTVTHYFDPQVEFLELGLTENGKTTWKLMGPDRNGIYGGANGLGGFDGYIPDGGLFCPIISDYLGNLDGYLDANANTFVWNPSRLTGFGAVPTYRPVAFGSVGSIAYKCAWRNRAAECTGYIWMGARFYDPETGQFLSFDPMWNSADPNGYSAFGGNPIRNFDRDGRCSHQDGDPDESSDTAEDGNQNENQNENQTQTQNQQAQQPNDSRFTLQLYPGVPGTGYSLRNFYKYAGTDPKYWDDTDKRYYDQVSKGTSLYPFGGLSEAEITTTYRERGYVSFFDLPIGGVKDLNGGYNYAMDVKNLIATFLTSIAGEAAFSPGGSFGAKPSITIDIPTVEELSGAPQGTGPLSPAEKPPITIGEDMLNRVIPFSEMNGFEYYKPGPSLGSQQADMAANRAWMQSMINEGRTFIDIGPAPGRLELSPYYQMESELINQNTVPAISFSGFK